MRFLILPREGAPTVSFVVQFQVGSVNEVLGYTGIAHLLEHMLFKGSTTIGTRNLQQELELFPGIDALMDSIIRARAAPAEPDTARVAELLTRLKELEDSARTFVVSNEFDRILTRNGARGLNASTSTEATTYYVQLPANRAELWFTLEADRMRNPVFREFYTERDVVAEERRTRTETSPGGLLREALLNTAYTVHPYGVPVIGYMSDIQNLTREQVEEYYARYYGPNNVVVAIVGDIDADTTLARAERYFGDIPRGESPPPVLAREPPQRGERRVEVIFDAQPQMRIGWHTVSQLHPDAAPLSILGALLTGGRTSRLYRRLVIEDRIAQTVTAGGGPGARYPQLFTISAAPRSPHTTAELEAAIYQELGRLRETPPTTLELERVRNQVEAGSVRRLDSSFGLAVQLANSEALYDDWRETFRSAERLREVTPADIQRVVQTYFQPENRTVAVLRSEDQAPEAES